jgi:WD40 repeat protein
VAFAQNSGLLVAGGLNGAAQVWDVRQPNPVPELIQLPGLGINTVAFSQSGEKLALGTYDGAVRLFDLSQRAAPVVLHGHRLGLDSVAFSPDGQSMASGSRDGTVRIWDLGQSVAARVVPLGTSASPNSLAFSADGSRLAWGAAFGAVSICDVMDPNASPVSLGGFDGYAFASNDARAAVKTVAFSPDGGNLLACSMQGTVRTWDLRNPGAAPAILPGNEDLVVSMAFSPVRQMMALGRADGTVALRKDPRQPGAPTTVLGGTRPPDAPLNFVNAVSFSPDEHWLAAGCVDGAVRLWDARELTSDPVLLRGHEDNVMSLAFSPDSRWLASGFGDSIVKLWDLRRQDAKPLVLRGHENSVSSLAFSADGRWLASGSWDTTVRLWDRTLPDAPPLVLRGHESKITAVAFSPDGERLASGDQQSIRISMVSTAKLAGLVPKKVWRNLTLDEWRQFVGEDIPYERTCPDLPDGEGVTPGTTKDER